MTLFSGKPRNCTVTAPDQLVGSESIVYLPVANQLPAIHSFVPCNKNAERYLNSGIRVVIQLVLMYHMRCAECLDIRYRDMYRPFMFFVGGKKSSRDYSIHIPLGHANLSTVLKYKDSTRLFPYAYNTIWRAMVNAGMSVGVTSRVNRIVTHRGRYDVADKLVELNKRASITPLLRHKSDKSKAHYVGVLGA